MKTFALPAVIASGLAAALVSASAQDPPSPRQGLTARETTRAVKIAGEALEELRSKTEGLKAPEADTREYVVSVERLNEKDDPPPPPPQTKAPAKPAGGDGDQAEKPRGKAVVTTYRYFDDTTIYTTVDLTDGKPIEVETAQHMRTPLSDGEYDSAQKLAREKSEQVRELYEKFGKRLSVYAQFSQYVPDGETRVHRVVLILYRVDKRDLSAPRPVVDLTTREVTIPKPEAEDPAPRPAAKPND